MGLYRKAKPDELLGATVLLDPVETANKSKPANKSRGRPVKVTDDPAKDKRNAQQRELMRKRRAAGK